MAEQRSITVPALSGFFQSVRSAAGNVAGALDLSSVLPSSPPPPSPHQSDSFIKEIKAEQNGTVVGVFYHQFVGTET